MCEREWAHGKDGAHNIFARPVQLPSAWALAGQ
jgi:hypothetical protein